MNLLFLEICTAVLLAASVVMFCYIRYLEDILDSHHEALERIAADLEATRARMRVHERRIMKATEPEKIIIEHEYKPAKHAPRFPNKEGF